MAQNSMLLCGETASWSRAGIGVGVGAEAAAEACGDGVKAIVVGVRRRAGETAVGDTGRSAGLSSSPVDSVLGDRTGVVANNTVACAASRS